MTIDASEPYNYEELLETLSPSKLLISARQYLNPIFQSKLFKPVVAGAMFSGLAMMVGAAILAATPLALGTPMLIASLVMGAALFSGAAAVGVLYGLNKMLDKYVPATKPPSMPNLPF